MTKGPPEEKVERVWRKVREFPAIAIVEALQSFLDDRNREFPTPLEISDRCERELKRLEAEYSMTINPPAPEQEPIAEMTEVDREYRSAIAGKGLADWLRSGGSKKETIEKYLDRINREFNKGPYEQEKK